MPSYHHFISLTTPGGAMPVYIAAPEGRGPHPAVLVIQGMHGVEAFELSVAERLAEHGYVGAVPDLFHRGPACFLREELDQRRRGMSDPQVIGDVSATMRYLQEQPYVRADRIGIIGFCMGGRVSYLMAATSAEIRVAADFYGDGVLRGEEGPAPFELTSRIRCPVAIFDGEEDPHPSPEEVRKIEAELARHGVVHEVHIYPGVGHGFMSAQGARRRADVIEDAWSCLLSWLAQPLASEVALSHS